MVGQMWTMHHQIQAPALDKEDNSLFLEQIIVLGQVIPYPAF